MFKKGSSGSINNYGPASVLKNFSEVFECVIPNQICCHFKSQLHFCQLCVSASESTLTRRFRCHFCVTPSVRPQLELLAVYFCLSPACVPVVRKFDDRGLSAGCVIWRPSPPAD